MSQTEFRALLKQHWPQLTSEAVASIEHFRGLVVDENSRQNLTRLISPKDFYWGHVHDVQELLAHWKEFFDEDQPILDLGSGVGVPGLLTALIQQAQTPNHSQLWVLTESEKRKAEFLFRTVQALNLDSRVTVYPGRGEEYLRTATQTVSVISRAVGSIERQLAWIGGCSTWNNLVLFKGPKWEEEWKAYRALKNKPARLHLLKRHTYQKGDPEDGPQHPSFLLRFIHD